jgi:hypothetical protein
LVTDYIIPVLAKKSIVILALQHHVIQTFLQFVVVSTKIIN